MPRECGACLTILDRGGSVYLLPQTVLTSYRLPAAEVPGLRAELLADTRGFGPEPGEVAVWLPVAALEEGKADILRRLAELPREGLEEVVRAAGRGTASHAAPTRPAGQQAQEGGSDHAARVWDLPDGI